MKEKIQSLLLKFLADLEAKIIAKEIKWRFNFTYEENNLIESYSSEIRINNKLTGIRITKSSHLENHSIVYDISIDTMSFLGYIDSNIKNKIESIIVFIEKNDLITGYPLAIQQLIDYNSSKSEKQSNEKKSDNKNTSYVLFSAYF